MQRLFLILFFLSAHAAMAQDAATQVAVKSTTVRTAPIAGTVPTPAVGQLAPGATVQVIGHDRQWVRVRLEGWVRESDLRVVDSTLMPLSAADLRSDPAGSHGKLVQWNVQAVSLQTADPLRSGLQSGEQYLLALGPGPEKALIYIAVPESLLATARSLPSLADITVVARVRNGRSEPAGIPILDLQSFTRR